MAKARLGVAGHDMMRRTAVNDRDGLAIEAQMILSDQIRRLRALPYSELLRYREPDAFEVAAPSGRIFQVEVLAVWDDRKRRHLRVLVHMDNSMGMRARPYLIDNFIIAPDGSFVGES
jgi:hypothetical protein